MQQDKGIEIEESLRPVVILARPQMGENIGACARAMKNCGVFDLRLINPRDGWPNPLAVPMATNATDILDDVKVFQKLDDALYDVKVMFATTARLRGMVKPVINPRQAAHYLCDFASQQIAQEKAGDEKARAAILFGAERSGLDNDEVALADYIVQAELNPDSTSLNIAQAVLMMCWEWRMAALENSNSSAFQKDKEEANPPASLQSRSYFFERLEAVLDEQGFFASADIAPTVKRNLRNFFTRGKPTEQELRTLHGILSLFGKNSD